MKKTGLIVLFGFLVFTVFSLLGVSEISGPVVNKKAVWNITRAICDPNCYRPLPLTHAVVPVKHKLTFEFKATKALVPAGDLWISGELISNVDSGLKPFVNLSAICAGWADGTTDTFDWNGDLFQLTKVNRGNLILFYDGIKIKAGTIGEVKIIITAESRDKKGVYYKEKKTLIIKPCLTIPIVK